MYSASFPSRFRKFVRVPVNWLSEALSQFLGGLHEEINGERVFKTNVKGGLGVKLKLRIIPEGDFSSLEFDFNYRSLIFMVFAIFILLVGLSLIFSSIVPLTGLIAIPLLIYVVGFKVNNFISEFSGILLGLEAEYARRKLMEDRIRWQSNPKDIDDLYRRLREKYIKIWGSTYALEYKMNEYQRQGLTRNEAVRKIAEEEGVF